MGAGTDPVGRAGEVGQAGPKRIHPFFAPGKPMPEPMDTTPSVASPAEESPATSPPEHDEGTREIIEEDALEQKSGRKAKRQKVVDAARPEESSDGGKSIKKRGGGRRSKASMGANLASHFTKTDQDAGQGKEKDEAAVEPTTTSTHPFFLGKPKPPIPNPPEAPAQVKNKTSSAPTKNAQFTSTPCSPKKPRAAAPNRMPQFGVRNAGLKHPGAKLPAWPWNGAVHTRGMDAAPETGVSLSTFRPRKSKGHSVKITDNESLMGHMTSKMGIPAVVQALRDVHGDDFAPPPVELRLPLKHFESGSKLQFRILGELASHHALPSRTPKPGASVGQLPPQLAPLFNMIKTSLSAFDRSECETSLWAHKYAPKLAIEVVQSGREALMLRDWLQALEVQSVHTGTPDGEKAKKSKSGAPKKKKKKKLDDFIVSSDEEDNEMNELSEGEADWGPSGSHGQLKKTVVRAGDLRGRGSKDGTRITNIVVISGPHGCGKTAAVYAAAQELDFEVFEINPSSRRSGKDITEKIGDMTTNHLVQQQQQPSDNAEAPELTAVEDDALEDEVEKDIKSGKQSTMNAFFKAKPNTVSAAKKAVKPPPAKLKAEKKETKLEAKKETPKSQKQSLILLDEADILYEEDKQFWTTVIALASQSKRPFIITCNDETLLPLQSLALHAILRFSPPPLDLAVDRLLLIAANEGHALERGAVEMVYEARNRDLRAATTDLNYWCQMGVGDRRGGFEWFYPRWPRGVDLDENKEVVRVVSEGTYQPGMNWIGRDSIVDSTAGPAEVEYELLSQAWDFWDFDLEHWHDSTAFSSWAEKTAIPSTAADRLNLLEAYDEFADAMSAADLCSWGSFGLHKQEILDPTLPPLTEKAREDFTYGLLPLESPSLMRYDHMTTSLPSALKSLSWAVLRNQAKISTGSTASDLERIREQQLIDRISGRFHATHPFTTAITRMDFAHAFDPIADTDTGSAAAPATYLDPSVFDRTLTLITLDVAPYVRGIVGYEAYLQRQRQKLSKVLGDGARGSQGKKRMRTTRAALSALEGGSRSTTRGARWFKAELNPFLVMKTAGEGWDTIELPESVSLPTSPAKSASASPPRPPPPANGRRKRGRPKIVDDDSTDEIA